MGIVKKFSAFIKTGISQIGETKNTGFCDRPYIFITGFCCYDTGDRISIFLMPRTGTRNTV